MTACHSQMAATRNRGSRAQWSWPWTVSVSHRSPLCSHRTVWGGPRANPEELGQRRRLGLGGARAQHAASTHTFTGPVLSPRPPRIGTKWRPDCPGLVAALTQHLAQEASQWEGFLFLYAKHRVLKQTSPWAASLFLAGRKQCWATTPMRPSRQGRATKGLLALLLYRRARQPCPPPGSPPPPHGWGTNPEGPGPGQAGDIPGGLGPPRMVQRLLQWGLGGDSSRPGQVLTGRT